MRIKQECKRCGHVWKPYQERQPRRCPNCFSAYWDRARRVKKEPSLAWLKANPTRTYDQSKPMRFNFVIVLTPEEREWARNKENKKIWKPKVETVIKQLMQEAQKPELPSGV